MPTIQLGSVLERRDPLLLFKWYATSVPFAELGPIGPEYIETIEIPFNNVKSEPVFRGGGYVYFPGFHDVSAFNVTFYADAQGRSLKYLMQWKDKIKNFKTGIYALPGAYKRDWQVALLAPDGTTVATAKLIGCWPADTNQINLDYNDGSGRVPLNQNFSVDDMEFSVGSAIGNRRDYA